MKNRPSGDQLGNNASGSVATTFLAAGETIRIARLAKETGLFPVFEAEHGEVVGISRIRRRLPAEAYLKPQRRFAHLFAPRRRDDMIAKIQAIADRNIRRFGLLEQTH